VSKNVYVKFVTRSKRVKGTYTSKCCEGDRIKEDEMGSCSTLGGRMRNEYKILVEKPEGKRPLRRHRWWEVADWIHMALDRDQ
jgi:hypothetical protein